MKKFLILAIVLLTGCATPRAQAPAAVYDFGAQRLAAGLVPGYLDDKRLRASIWVPDVLAPVWLDNTAILYRLAYHDLAQVYAYGSSRWAATPAILLTQRIRSRIAMVNDAGVISAAEGARTNYMLRLELEEFSQIFDTTDSSRAVIRLRASLIDRRTRLLLSQRNFSIEQPSLAPNASGGVRALTEASDNLIGSLIGWLAEELPEGDKHAYIPYTQGINSGKFKQITAQLRRSASPDLPAIDIILNPAVNPHIFMSVMIHKDLFSKSEFHLFDEFATGRISTMKRLLSIAALFTLALLTACANKPQLMRPGFICEVRLIQLSNS